MNEQDKKDAVNMTADEGKVSKNDVLLPDEAADGTDDPARDAALGQEPQGGADPAPSAQESEPALAFSASDEAAALRQAFPYLPEAGRSTMAEAPRYRALRALGLSAKEAALAAFGELPAMGVAGQGKAHLTDPAGRAGLDPLPTMSEEQYATAREVFGDAVSDAELEALFRRVR